MLAILSPIFSLPSAFMKCRLAAMTCQAIYRNADTAILFIGLPALDINKPPNESVPRAIAHWKTPFTPPMAGRKKWSRRRQRMRRACPHLFSSSEIVWRSASRAWSSSIIAWSVVTIDLSSFKVSRAHWFKMMSGGLSWIIVYRWRQLKPVDDSRCRVSIADSIDVIDFAITAEHGTKTCRAEILAIKTAKDYTLGQ